MTLLTLSCHAQCKPYTMMNDPLSAPAVYIRFTGVVERKVLGIYALKATRNNQRLLLSLALPALPARWRWCPARGHPQSTERLSTVQPPNGPTIHISPGSQIFAWKTRANRRPAKQSAPLGTSGELLSQCMSFIEWLFLASEHSARRT
jgi:hypothetical protein